MLVNSPIPSLFNGVSQQPAPLRTTSQCELQENAYSDIATGLRKRPPTEHIAKLTSSSYAQSHIHTINRDANEKYTVVITNGNLAVYDFAGVAKTVTFPLGTFYLNSTNPRDEFAIVTVADYSFVVNKTVMVQMAVATATPAAISGTKQKFSDLPVAAATGQLWKIQGDPSNHFGDYFVLDAVGSVWVEHAGPAVKTTIDPATMPHKLVRNADGTFTFTEITWGVRDVGDDTSNPPPSFVNRKIKDIFFYRNRLGMLADEQFICSRSADYFIYWIETITAALDSDPIDGDASHNKVSLLNWAVPFSKQCLLFSNATQFQITGGEALTPKTAKADPVTEFESSATCRPTALGNEVFFAQPRGEATGVLEYFVERDTITNDASDTTAHVPNYVPKNTYKLAGSSTENVLFALTTQETNAVYTYKYYWKGDEKLQSCWSKFLFDAGDIILNVDFIGQIAYFVIERADGVHFEQMNMRSNTTDTGFNFKMLLDRRVQLTGVYDAANDRTDWTLPYADNGAIQVVLGAAFGSSKGTLMPTTRPSSTVIRTTGNYSVGTCFVGRKYTKRFRFSNFYYRDQKGAVQEGRLQIQRAQVSYDKSGYFRVEVTPLKRAMNTYAFTGKILGSLTLGVPGIESGTFKFPVMTRNEGVIIDIVNDSPFPSTIQSANWDGDFVMFSQRITG